MKNPLAASLILFQSTTLALGHEYWIEAENYQISQGNNITADLKNGQNFRGSTYPYLKRNFKFFKIITPKGEEEVTGRDGDIPAIATKTEQKGLHILSYQGDFSKITFKDPEKLENYFSYEGLENARAHHLSRGLSMDHFQEHYARCAKALIQVGKADPAFGGDRLTGLEFELVVETNPYLESSTKTLPVRLYWQGKPAKNTQIHWFYEEQTVQTNTVRTDEDGRAHIPVFAGGKFLLNAVKLIEGDNDPDTDIPQWYSYWASTTFQTADSPSK